MVERYSSIEVGGLVLGSLNEFGALEAAHIANQIFNPRHFANDVDDLMAFTDKKCWW